MKSKIKNILIVDDDLGFIFWLGGVLVDAGYQPWPACSPSDAISLAGHKLQPDLLIVNASLPVVPELIAHFRNTQTNLKVMAWGSQATTLPGVNAWRPTPGLSDSSAKLEWVRAVKHLSSRQHRPA
jgi:CheY-like chemotaxis protein